MNKLEYKGIYIKVGESYFLSNIHKYINLEDCNIKIEKIFSVEEINNHYGDETSVIQYYKEQLYKEGYFTLEDFNKYSWVIFNYKDEEFALPIHIFINNSVLIDNS